MTRLHLTARDVELQLLSSPLRAVEVRPGPGGALEASVKLGRMGEVSFSMPRLRVDWASRSLVAEGAFRYKDLQLPLDPVLSWLRSAGMEHLADKLPRSLALRPMGLTAAAAMLAELITRSLGTGALAERAREELNRLVGRLDGLPARLRGLFLTIEPPSELAYRIQINADLGASVALMPPPGRGARASRAGSSPMPAEPYRAEGTSAAEESDPVRFMVPVLGPHGPELLGLSLWRLSFGRALGGLTTVEVDAEIDRFDLLPIALSTSLSETGHFAPPDRVEQRILCRDVSSLLIVTGGAAALVPVSFRQIGLEHSGIDGLRAAVRWSLSGPRLDEVTAARAALDLGRAAALAGASAASLELPSWLQCSLAVGPCYVRLPAHLGGGTLGVTDTLVLVDSRALIESALSAARALDMDRLLATLPAALGEHEIDIALGPGYRKALRVWSAVAEPALLLSSGAGAGDEPAQPRKKEGLSGKLKALRGRVTEGLSALSGDERTTRLRARVEGVSSTGLSLRAKLPDPAGGPPREALFELRWANLIGSAAGLAAMG